MKVELRAEIKAEPRDVLLAAFNVMSRVGRIVDNAGFSSVPSVSAVIGSGVMNLNPAVVTVQVTPTSNATTLVGIRGIAKEALIKQHTGEKAAKRIADLLLRDIVCYLNSTTTKSAKLIGHRRSS